jgi:hypothetical protein
MECLGYIFKGDRGGMPPCSILHPQSTADAVCSKESLEELRPRNATNVIWSGAPTMAIIRKRSSTPQLLVKNALTYIRMQKNIQVNPRNSPITPAGREDIRQMDTIVEKDGYTPHCGPRSYAAILAQA